MSRATPGAGEWGPRYDVVRRIGQGGMGAVYEVFDHERRQAVALKTLLRFSPAALYRFKQEFRTLADVAHDNLVRLHELVVTEAQDAFFTMELVGGTDFLSYVRRIPAVAPPPADDPETIAVRRTDRTDRSRLTGAAPDSAPVQRKQSPADFERLRRALLQLASGIRALHAAGKLHRDIKPSNVLVTPDGRVVILDFGVATEVAAPDSERAPGDAEASEVVGTARYMAPEYASDSPATPASDWYSVGVMLYEALVGGPPFEGPLVDVLTMKNKIDPLPPSEYIDGVPAELDALAMALLCREPALRPSGSGILRALGVSLFSRPVSAPPVPAGARPLVGRDPQLTSLKDAFEATRAGRTVTVRVGGESGMGKSTLVEHFLDQLASSRQALVLRGRAYERESVPYKAVDSVVDALSRHLFRHLEIDSTFELPAGIGALARLFPVLRRIPNMAGLLDLPGEDPHRVRSRAFAALRELFAALARQRPLVVYLDDVQWGDVDSVDLLVEIMRPPSPPPLLLLMTYREGETESSPFLVEMQTRWPDRTGVRDLSVGPLDAYDARELALSLLGASDEVAQRMARAVARESRGSPFLIEELVRGNRGNIPTAESTLGALNLEQIVGNRLDKLPGYARRLLEIVAVAGRPVPLRLVAEAAALKEPVDEVVTLLREQRFAVTGMRAGHEVVETIQERIRETIIDLLPQVALREHHGRLARALEAQEAPDPEAIAVHLLGSGQKERVPPFAERAAEGAASKFAFDQAARLFRLAIDTLPASSVDAARLRARLGEVLERGGRYAEAARAYLKAADELPDRRMILRRAAAEQLLAAGRIDEGAEVLHGVLAAVGMHAPRSPMAALFWLAVYRIGLLFLGSTARERDPSEVSAEDRLRVDALYAVAMGFAMVDAILGACTQARHLIEALRKGDRFQVVRAAALWCGQLAALGGGESKRERAFAELGDRFVNRLVERDGPQGLEGRALMTGVRGLGLFLRGRWPESREKVMLLDGFLPNSRAFWQTNAHLFYMRDLYFMGELKELAVRQERLHAEARERGDLYMLVNLDTTTRLLTPLVVDDAGAARRNLEEAMAKWSQTAFFVQQWQAMVYGPDVDLYEGRGARAYERFMRDLPRLKRSFLLRSEFIRVVTLYSRGRFAVASIEGDPSRRAARVAEARQMARRLERELAPWAAGLAAIVKAVAENAAGDRRAALAALRQAVRANEMTHTIVYAVSAQYRLGQLLGGEEGREIAARAAQHMSEQGVRNAERWASIALPGKWG